MAFVSNPVKEYNDILNLLNNGAAKDDVYDHLMQREKEVLNAVNRVAESEMSKTTYKSSFLNMSVIDLIGNFAKTWLAIYTEFLHLKNPRDIVRILWTRERKIYVGIMIVGIALFFFFVDIA